MKIAICGKGGSGKSTISALLAKAMARRGYNVLVVDVDESNYGLHRQLGMAAPRDLVDYFGGKSEATKLTVDYYNNKNKDVIFKEKWAMTDIPEGYTIEKGGIRLMAIGKIHEFGEGCACTMGTISGLFFENLSLGDRDVVIVDTEAGIEHMGRGIERGFDYVLAVVDPSYESLRLCKKIEEMAEGNASKTYFVLNKADSEVAEEMLSALDCSNVAAVIPASKEIFRATLAGKELDLEVKEIEALAGLLHQGANNLLTAM